MPVDAPVYVAALRALAAAGASDRLLSQAVRELLAGEERPGLQAAAPAGREPFDGPRNTSHSPSPRDITAASDLPGGSASLPATKVSPKLSTGLAKRKPVIVVFKEANGHRTSVSLAADKWAALLDMQPNAALVTKLVREFGPAAPQEVNRSSWVYEQVVSRLRSPSQA